LDQQRHGFFEPIAAILCCGFSRQC
jgi:hypothetical protein